MELLKVTGATASRHLSQLVGAGLLKNRKDGRWIYYSLEDNPFTFVVIEKWLIDQLSQSEQLNYDLEELKKEQHWIVKIYVENSVVKHAAQ